MPSSRLFPSLAVVLLGGALGLASCAPSLNINDTRVGHQELYKTGNAEYDEFFEDVNLVQHKSKAMDEDAAKARAPLSEHLGAVDAPLETLVAKIKARAEDLAQSKAKVSLSLEGLDDQGKPAAGKSIEIKSAGKGKVPKEASEFASAIEETAKAEAQLWETYAPLSEKTHRMGDKVLALNETVDKDFASKEKRQEVRRELGAARAVLKDIANHADQLVAGSLKFLRDASEGLGAAANAEPHKKDKKRPAKGGPASLASKPAASKPQAGDDARPEPKPEPKPAAPAPPAADFNP